MMMMTAAVAMTKLEAFSLPVPLMMTSLAHGTFQSATAMTTATRLALDAAAVATAWT